MNVDVDVVLHVDVEVAAVVVVVVVVDGEVVVLVDAEVGLVYLVSSAGFMFVSGWVAERMDLRYFLSGEYIHSTKENVSHNFPGGMILSGVVTFFFGFAKFADIHSFGYLIAMQVIFFLL